MSDEFVRVAKVLITQRRYPEAVRTCRRALLADPDHLEGRLVLGMALMAMRRYGEVRAEMAMALRTAPTHPVALRLQGEAHLKEADFAKAEANLKKALHAAPADVVTRELLLELEEARQGEREETTTVERWFDPGRGGQQTQTDFVQEETTVRGQNFDDFEQGVETRVVDAQTAERLRREAGISNDAEVSAPGSLEETTSARPTVRMRSGASPPMPTLPRDTLPPPEPILDVDGDEGVVVDDAQVVSAEDDGVLSAEEMDDLVVDETSAVTDDPESPLALPAPTVRTKPAAASRRPAARPASSGAVVARAPAPSGVRPSAPPPAVRPRSIPQISAQSAPAPVARPSAPAPVARPSAPAPVARPSAPPASRPSAPPPAPRARSATLLGMPAVTTAAASPPGARPAAMPAPAAVRPSASPSPPTAAPKSAAPERPKLASPFPELEDLGYDDEEPATTIRESGAVLAGIAERALEEPVADIAPLGKTMPPSRVQASGLRPSAPPPPRASAPPLPRAVPGGPAAVEIAPVIVDRRLDPTPPPRSAMEAPSLPPSPPDADPFGRVAIPATRYGVPAPALAASVGRRRRSTAVFVIAGVAGGAALLATGIFVVRNWSRGEKRDERLAEAARADLAGSESDLRAALAAHEAILEGDPGSPEARAGVARAAAWLAVEFEDAAAAARAEAVLTGLQDPALGAATEAKALLLFRGGRVADAQRMLDAVASPDARTLYAKGLVASARGELDVAARSLGQAATVAPSDLRIVALLAETLHRLGDANGANQRLSSVDPAGARSRTRLARARALLASSHEAEARVEAEALLVLAPPAAATEKAWAELVRGCALRREDPAAANAAADRSEGGRRPWDVEFATTRARLLLDLGRPREARLEAERALTTAPDRPEVKLLVAEGALRSGDLEAAASALASVPPLSEAAALAGEVALARGDLPGARTRFEEAARDASLLPRAKIGLARVAVAEGRIRDAAGLLADVPPAIPGASVLGAEVRWSLGEVAAAREALAAAGADPAAKVLSARIDAWTGRVGPANEALRAIVGATPANIGARVALADLLQQSGELGAAAEQIEAARALAPASAEVQLATAYQAAAEGRLDAADQAVAAARAAGAPAPAIARASGRIALCRRKAAEAVQALREALRGAPRDPWIEIWIGQAYLLDERSGEASDAFSKALRIDARLPEAHVGLALAGLISGSFAAVGENLERADRDLGDHPRGDKLRAQVLFVRGRFHWENGNYDEAGTRLREATEKDPDLAEAFAFLGYAILDGRGARADACAAFARYLEIAPDGPEAGEVHRLARGCG